MDPQMKQQHHQNVTVTMKQEQTIENHYNTNAQNDNDLSSEENHQESEKKQFKQVYITDPHQFLQFCINDKKIKVMDQQNPILSNVYLKDISLHKKGPLEDKIYSKNSKYYCNIRRGNTLCQIYKGTQPKQDQQKKSQLFMCRRGMKKFYDLEPEYLKINRQLTYQHERYRRRIFEKLDQQIDKGDKVIHLYGLFKENGEHCQVSYVSKLGYWLFASKNVAILAKDEADLENNYEKERFYWAKLIGHEFFKIINKFSQEQKEKLMKDLQGKTLLGEHCGYEKHEHITKYNQIQLIFYGLVENNGVDHCMPVDQCQRFLNKYGFKMSKMWKILGLKQKNKIYESMYKTMKKIAEGTIDQNGQGSVLYIVTEDKQGNQRTVGMCKLKTCQYLIYRKMREMIKIYFAKKGSTANNFQKFKFQVQNLTNSYFKPPKPLQYYYEIADQAFREVRKNGKDFTDDQFRYKFVSFLSNIENRTKGRKQSDGNEKQIKQIKRIILITPPLLQQESHKLQKVCRQEGYGIEYAYRQNPPQKLIKSTMNILHMVPRINLHQIQPNTIVVTYEIGKQKTQKLVQELESTADLKKSHLITFIKSQHKLKSLDLLKEKITAFDKSCQQKSKQGKLQYFHAQNIDQILRLIQSDGFNIENKQSIKQEGQNDYKKNHGTTHVIITLLIPGSGKSSLAQTLSNQFSQSPHIDLTIISSDKIRQGVMEKYKVKNPKKQGNQFQIQELYAATKKKGLQKYRETVNQAIGENPPQKGYNRIIFLDRVFCPTTVLQNIQQIAKPWTKFIIVTHVQVPTKLNDYIYPHSITFLLGCIKRSIERQGHETLSINPNEIVKVVLKFYQMYRGFTFNKLQRQLEDLHIDHKLICLQFLKESGEGQNLHLKKKLEQCLKGIPPGHDAPESQLYTELIQLIYKYSEHIERKKTQQTEDQKNQMLKNNALKLIKLCK